MFHWKMFHYIAGYFQTIFEKIILQVLQVALWNDDALDSFDYENI